MPCEHVPVSEWSGSNEMGDGGVDLVVDEYPSEDEGDGVCWKGNID